jgi:hypothetical protein
MLNGGLSQKEGGRRGLEVSESHDPVDPAGAVANLRCGARK